MNSISLLRPAGLDGHQHCDMSDKKFHNERCKAWVFYNSTVPKKWKLQEAIKKEPPQTQLLFKTCKMALKETTSFSNALIFGSADIYYIPISLIGQASTLINLYSKVRIKDVEIRKIAYKALCCDLLKVTLVRTLFAERNHSVKP